MVEVHLLHRELRRMLRNHDTRAGPVLPRVAAAHLDPHLPGQVELGQRVLAGTGVLGLLDHDDPVLVQLLCQGEGGSKRRVARRPPLHTFQLCQQLGDVEHLALGHRNKTVHVAQCAGGIAGYVGAIRPAAEGYREAGMAGGEGLAVEVMIRGHVQTGKVNTGGDHDAVPGTGLPEPACRARHVAAAGMRGDDHIRESPGQLPDLSGQFEAQRLDAEDGIRGIQGGIEVAGFPEHLEEDIEEFRPYRQADHLGAIGLTGAGLLGDLGLCNACAVKGLLHHNAMQARPGGLRGHCRAVVAAGGRHHPGITTPLRLVHRQRGTPVLERTRGIRGLVLEQDPRPLARRGQDACQRRDVVKLNQRRLPHARTTLDATRRRHIIACIREQPFVVKGENARRVLCVVDPAGVAHNRSPLPHDGLVVTGAHLMIPRSRSMARTSPPMAESSGSGAPKPWV